VLIRRRNLSIATAIVSASRSDSEDEGHERTMSSGGHILFKAPVVDVGTLIVEISRWTSTAKARVNYLPMIDSVSSRKESRSVGYEVASIQKGFAAAELTVFLPRIDAFASLHGSAGRNQRQVLLRVRVRTK
jgi:hypothetical protein